VWRFWNDPVSGIGPSGYLVQTDAGNMVFEGAAVWSEAALEQVAALGGCQVPLRLPPPCLRRALAGPGPLRPGAGAPPGDFGWTSALRVSWPFDDRLEPLPGLSLHLTAGHFAGHACSIDARRRILFCGDALKFELDPENPRRALTISAHKAFVRGVPLSPDELRRYRAVFAPLDFVQTWTPFEQAANSGRTEALALIDGMLATRPHAAPVALDALRR
jgi:hypothetical protein